VNILFYSSHDDISVASYRIWVRDLNSYFNSVGVSSQISVGKLPDLSEFDVIIFGKGDYIKAQSVKANNPTKKVGVINLARDVADLDIDFIIVGSIEEQASHSLYDNVFLFPLIENMYQNNIMYKEHIDSDILTIGYHGNITHTSKFLAGVTGALEKLSEQYPVEFVIISSALMDQSLLPKGVEVSVEPWVQERMFNRILSFDVGVVPNAVIGDVKSESPSQGLFSTDYEMRFKNKSNAGRAFVFHQLGIPVVADITPSHFHIMGNPDCGHLVANEVGWYKALLKLTDFRERQRIADNAKVEFDRLYNPYDWVKRLYHNIEEI